MSKLINLRNAYYSVLLIFCLPPMHAHVCIQRHLILCLPVHPI